MKDAGKFHIVEENHTWIPCKAKSLGGAKRAAKALQTYLGTKLFVSMKHTDGQYQLLSTWQWGKWNDTPAADYTQASTPQPVSTLTDAELKTWQDTLKAVSILDEIRSDYNAAGNYEAGDKVLFAMTVLSTAGNKLEAKGQELAEDQLMAGLQS